MENTNNRKFTVLSFFIVSALFAFVFFRGFTQVADWTKTTNIIAAAVGGYPWKVVGGSISGLVGFILFLGLSMNRKATAFTDEVFAEARKVTWPSGQETYKTTLVVGIMVIVAGLLFFLLDNIWNWIFRALLS